MDRTYSYSMLIKWLDTFNIEARYHNTDELSTGIAMSQILNKIDPKFFSDQWLQSMFPDPGNNKKQRLPNLRNRGFPLPDINAIAETSSMKELVCFLQLILVCAMYCEENTHIHQIMEMEESVQQ
ncbi:hypothetical protein Ahia01_000434500, partial [Argonauta hians]